MSYNINDINNESLGFIETRTLVGAIEASDAMVKAANVKLVNDYRIGAALVTVVVKGSLADCYAAVDAGKEAALKIGELISAHVIARPFKDTNNLVNSMIIPNKENNTEHKEKTIAEGKKTRDKKENRNEIKYKSIDDKDVSGKKVYDAIQTSEGIDINKLSEKTGIMKSELRIILKQMIDESKIEKAGNKYFIKK